MKNQLFATAFTATVATPLILISSLLTTQNILADSVNVDDEGGLQLSITANRRAQPIDKTLASVTVITKDDIETSQASSVQELLQATAGLQLVNSGGAGKLTSLFMRGTESDHTLVLIDGIKVNSGSDGAAAIQLIPIEMIDRIEIVRGPRTSLYGSDAIGGVIQIFTRGGFLITIIVISNDLSGVTPNIIS